MTYEDIDWEQAACSGINTDLFYLEDNNESRSMMPHLRRICRSCPILSECASYAVWNEMHGVWAGMTSEDRRLVRQRVRRAA